MDSNWTQIGVSGLKFGVKLIHGGAWGELPRRESLRGSPWPLTEKLIQTQSLTLTGVVPSVMALNWTCGGQIADKKSKTQASMTFFGIWIFPEIVSWKGASVFHGERGSFFSERGGDCILMATKFLRPSIQSDHYIIWYQTLKNGTLMTGQNAVF